MYNQKEVRTINRVSRTELHARNVGSNVGYDNKSIGK